MDYLYNTIKTIVMIEKVKILLLLLLVDFSLSAQNPGARKGFYGSFNIGPGFLNGNITSYEKQTSTQFAMHISVGYFLNHSLQLGITGCGWLFEPYKWNQIEPSGESLSNTILHVQVYPLRKYRLFLKGGYGISKYRNLQPEKDYGKGNGFMAAAGFEHNIGNKEVLCGTQLSYQNGKLRYGDLYTPIDLLDRQFQVLDLTLFISLD
jgi:hypothetical protein